MAVLGHRSANIAMTYARISDPEVRRQYEIALTNGEPYRRPCRRRACIDFKPLGKPSNKSCPHMPLSEHVPRLGLDLIPSLHDRRNDAATKGEGAPAITKSKPSLMVRTTDADRRSFTTFTKRAGRQLMPAAVWPGQGHFL